MSTNDVGAIPVSDDTGAIQSVPVVSPPIIASQSCEFGAKTLTTYGAFQLVNTGGASVTALGTVTGTSSSDYTVAIVSGQVHITVNGTASAGTLIFTVNGGSAITITITTIANSYSISTLAEMDATGQLAALAFGDTIYNRDGEYNFARLDVDTIKRTVVLTGTWDGTNYVKIKPHDGATAVNHWRTQVNGQTVKSGYFHFTKSDDGLSTMNFKGQDDGVFGGGSNAVLYFEQGSSNNKVSECWFENRAGSTQTSAVNNPGAVRFTGSGGSGGNIIDNNTFINSYVGIAHTGVTNDLVISNNTIREAWIDCIKFESGNDIQITDNLMYDKKDLVSAHGDYIQGVFAAAAADVEDITVTGNIAYRGDGVTGAPDGQFIFLSGNNVPGYDLLRATITNNFCLIEFVNGISVDNAKDCTISNNTCIGDNPDVNAFNTVISGEASAVDTSQGGNTVANNISTGGVQGFGAVGDTKTNNFNITRSEASYALNFTNPQYNTDVTTPSTEYSVLTSGPLDVSPAVGAFASTPTPTTGTGDAQGDRHRSFNALHGGALRSYNGDVVAGCIADEAGITATTFNGVLSQWLALKGYTNDTLNGRMNAFAIAKGAEKWSGLGTFTV